ncbi:MAG: hypothetical protein AAFR56_07465, partial [Chloroflexota bacterium]
EQPRSIPPEQTAMGVFLIGLAALAIFDFWFPGIFFVVAAAWLTFARVQGQPWGRARGAWLLIAVGGVFWLRDVMQAYDLDDYFVMVLLLVGTALTLGVDWRRLLRINTDDTQQ